MNVLLTGPCGAGKTTLAAQLGADAVVHLDRLEDLPVINSCPSVRGSHVVLYEGIPCGSDGNVAAFVGRMDTVLLLDAHPLRRVMRCCHRDGPGAIWRWIRNEWFWRRVTKKILVQHGCLQRVSWSPRRTA